MPKIRNDNPKKSLKKTLVILDAHAIIHRAYHALPNFNNSLGEPTGALYGIASMLIRIIEELKPDFIVAAYDLPKPTFRHIAYEQYKKGRAKADDDLITQIKSSRELFDAFNIECLDAEGFEADDIIGTIVDQYKRDKNLNLIIASGDMDTLQLVDKKKVQVFTLKKGVSETVLYDESEVVNRYGFEPKQLVDYKGLRGDPSDNIIGVPGIGDKTATLIIQRFNSIENFYKQMEKNPLLLKEAGLSERIINLLKEHQDEAIFSKTLATIRVDAPIKFALPNREYLGSVEKEKILAKLAHYEFRSLVPRLSKIFAFEQEVIPKDIDQNLLRLCSIGLWLLYSENTNPDYGTILERTHKKNLTDAYEVILVELKKKNLMAVFELIEKPLIPVITQMQDWGIAIDKKYFKVLKDKMKEQLRVIEKTVTELTGETINLNSPKQLSELLFKKLGLKPKGKAKASGAYTTNAETLEGLVEDHPVISKILEQREIQKLLTTYVEPLLNYAEADGLVHTTYLQNGTATGRFSSVNPNLQNLPAKGEAGLEIRHGFMARPGHIFIGCDYSQIELRILAILSEDSKLIETFKKGEDIHTKVASEMFDVPEKSVTADMRRKAKVINFGILYGMGISALQKNLKSTRAEAASYYQNYFETFPAINDYLEKTKEFAYKNGYVETMFGRKRHFPGLNSSAAYLRAFAERMAINAPIQGTNADLIKIALVLIDQKLKEAGLSDKVHPTLQIHDELVYEVESVVEVKAQKIIKETMVEVFKLSPIKVDYKGVPLGVSVGVGNRLDELK